MTNQTVDEFLGTFEIFEKLVIRINFLDPVHPPYKPNNFTANIKQNKNACKKFAKRDRIKKCMLRYHN